jgi:hypothetical protein
LTKDFDNDRRFILRVVAFLEDVEWLKREPNGVYAITEKAKTKGEYFLI